MNVLSFLVIMKANLFTKPIFGHMVDFLRKQGIEVNFKFNILALAEQICSCLSKYVLPKQSINRLKFNEQLQNN